VDVEPRLFGRNLHTRLGVVADIGATAAALIEQAAWQ
jgi:hypothetical protein